MKNRSWAIFTAVALAASMLALVPAQAQEEAPVPVVPAEPNITDPTGDANFINGSMIHPAVGGDHTGPADGSSIGDLMAGWFTNDAKSISAHLQVEAPVPGGNGISYNVFAAPGEGDAGSSTQGCLRFWLVLPGTNPGGGTYQGPPVAKLHDRCNTGGNIWDSPDVEFSLATAEDGTGIVTITAPRETSPLFVDDSVLATPYATSASPTFGTTGSAVTPTVDDTVRGLDYTVVAGDSAPPAETPGENPPPSDGEVGEDDPNVGGPNPDKPEPKDKCKGKKGKAKKKCKKKNKPGKGPKSGACPAYEPGELGAEAETVTVTDAATAEAPVIVEFDGGTGLGAPIVGGVPLPPDQRTHTYHNVQVDSDAAEAGLYVRLDFADRRDYDLYILHPTGEEASHSGHFNSLVEASVVFSCGDETTGCEAGPDYEQVGGLRTADCQGWTIDSVAFLSEGGNVTLSMWLGDVVVDPAAPGGS